MGQLQPVHQALLGRRDMPGALVGLGPWAAAAPAGHSSRGLEQQQGQLRVVLLLAVEVLVVVGASC